jgi:hypothetical protein
LRDLQSRRSGAAECFRREVIGTARQFRRSLTCRAADDNGRFGRLAARTSWYFGPAGFQWIATGASRGVDPSRRRRSGRSEHRIPRRDKSAVAYLAKGTRTREPIADGDGNGGAYASNRCQSSAGIVKARDSGACVFGCCVYDSRGDAVGPI